MGLSLNDVDSSITITAFSIIDINKLRPIDIIGVTHLGLNMCQNMSGHNRFSPSIRLLILIGVSYVQPNAIRIHSFHPIIAQHSLEQE